MEKITSKETPISKSLSKHTNKRISIKNEDIRSLLGKNTGISALVFKYKKEGFLHFFGVFESPDEIMKKYPGKWYKSKIDISLEGKQPDECMTMEANNGSYIIWRFV